MFHNCSDGETEAQSSVLAPTGEKAEFGAVKKAKCPAANRTTQAEQILGDPQGLGHPLAQAGLGSPTQHPPTVPLLFSGTHRTVSPPSAHCPLHSPQPMPTRLRGWLESPTSTDPPASPLSPALPATLHSCHLVPTHSLLQVGLEADERMEVGSWGVNSNIVRVFSVQACGPAL